MITIYHKKITLQFN